MDLHDYAEQNRRAWNQVQPIHLRERPGDLPDAVTEPDFSTLDATARAAFDRIGLADKAVAQFSCNNGRELISVLKAGARKGVGFDISDAFVEEARGLAARAQVEATFVRTNILEPIEGYAGAFDLVFATVGTLHWLRDLDAFFGQAERLLRPGGDLLLYEMHPLLDIFGNGPEDPGFDAQEPAKPLYSYFETAPWIGQEGLDYYGKSQYKSETTVGFRHPLGEIVTAVARAGLVVRELQEYPHDVSNNFGELAALGRFPVSYTLWARSPQA